ncbi:class II glutamine amidotransferase [Sinorhizobium meliloti]|uniref:class II glutamine amidotransferase n=1 Tax=Rhizobium meliloti TaxID=382 RepID=UPI001F3FD697|nr:class II glutamine amidotransferase [Sinorhizobium meliloti]
MCRWAAYRGEPLYLEELVTSPKHSLIEQSHCAVRAKTATNGDGFGIAWYGDRPEPGRYRDILPAWSDCNLKSIARQIRSPLFLAHVRAATGGGTRRDNCHPFVFGRWSFMHNGQIGDFEHLRRPMETMLDNELYSARSGTTDSELLFLLALQFGLDRDPLGAVAEALAFVERLAERLGRPALVRFTAAFSDGRDLYAVRYATDWKAPTLYAGPMGSSGGYCLVSEPLNDDDSAWVEVPDGSAIIVGENGVDVRLFGTADVAIARLPSVFRMKASPRSALRASPRHRPCPFPAIPRCRHGR